MKLSRTNRLRIVASVVGALALAGPVAAASANGFSLNLTAPSTPVVGTPMILHATGTIPSQDVWFPYWFSLDAIPTNVASTCPPDRWEGAQFTSAGGSIVVLSQSEVPDAGGNFSIPIAVTPSAPGSVLLCAYTDDGAAATLAAASLTLTIQSQPSTTTGAGSGAAGVVTEARHGIRSCLALLGPKDGRSCIRSAVRRANGACRRLQPASARAACLRGVGNLARKYS
jgi:hypothetical protein